MEVPSSTRGTYGTNAQELGPECSITKTTATTTATTATTTTTTTTTTTAAAAATAAANNIILTNTFDTFWVPSRSGPRLQCHISGRAGAGRK
eukprot:507742-Pelagomonas_calceolata.AAC.3